MYIYATLSQWRLRLKNKTFAIIKLISKYIVENDIINEEDIINDLLEKGFDIKEIDVALNWLESIGFEISDKSNFNIKGWRVLSTEEIEILTIDAKNYLFSLKEKGYIDNDTFENVLERILIASPERKIDIEEIKLLISLLSFNSIDAPDKNFLKIISDDGEILYN